MTDTTKELLDAAAKFIDENGGKAVVIGGVGLMKRPPGKYNYRLTIDFTGQPPSKPTGEEPKATP